MRRSTGDRMQPGMTGKGESKDTMNITWQQNTVRFSLRQIGWIPFGLAGLLLAALLLPGVNIFPDRTRIVELVVPLAAAFHAALILAPDDEPGLEVQLACPRPAPWLLLERLGLVLGGYGLLGLVVMTVGGGILMSWLPPMLALTSMAAYITLSSRTPAFSMAMVAVIGVVTNLFREALVPGAPIMDALAWLQPYMWVIHPYLPADSMAWYDYRANRAVIMLVGALLGLLAARFTRSGDRMLLG